MTLPQSMVALMLALTFCSCSSIKPMLDAKPVQSSEFLDSSHELETMGSRSPFLRTWTSKSQDQRIQSVGRTEIFIAPVETRFLRPIEAKMAARQQRRWNRERPVAQVANDIRTEFIAAFEKSDGPRYQLVDQPTANSVTLQLSLLELDPSSVSGNAVRKVASLKVGPPAMLAGMLTTGHIAIEGRLSDSTGGWSLFEFADNEKDKMTFWTLRDFKPYGHSQVAIREWARQFEKITRTPDWREMGDARIWTLRPW